MCEVPLAVPHAETPGRGSVHRVASSLGGRVGQPGLGYKQVKTPSARTGGRAATGARGGEGAGVVDPSEVEEVDPGRRRRGGGGAGEPVGEGATRLRGVRGGTAAPSWSDPGAPSPRLQSSQGIQASWSGRPRAGPVGSSGTRGSRAERVQVVPGGGGHKDRDPMASPAGIADRAGRGRQEKSMTITKRLSRWSPGPLVGLHR
ncbi:hypothetical protein MTO96_029561 [Rhipicephalus appendiculatus]